MSTQEGPSTDERREDETTAPSPLLPALGAAAIAFAAAEVAARRAVGSGEPFARVKRSVAIGAPPASAYAALADAATMARLVAPIAEVTEESSNQWTWRASGPMGSTLTMRSELVETRAGDRLAWRVGADALAPHEVSIDVMPGGAGSEAVVSAEIALYPSSRLPLLGTRAVVQKAADRTLGTALYRLRALLETGEMPTVDGQPSGMGEGKEGSRTMGERDRGLGKVVYGEEQTSDRRDAEVLQSGEDLVVEASEDSFPASDPPVFSRGAAAMPDVSSDAGGARE